MRFKFRGKRTDNGEWVYGYLAEIETAWDYYNGHGLPTEYKKVIIRTDILVREAIEIIPETVGQFTGLCDKNGKEIYEGDIAKAFMDFGPGGMAEQTVSIYWDENVGGWQFNYFDKSTIEVIGNIHDESTVKDND